MKINKKDFAKIIALAAIFGALAGVAASFLYSSFKAPSQNDLINDYYLVENAVLASPHSIRKAIDKGDSGFILVDLRSAQEYEEEHIIGAVNIPAYKDPNTSAYGDVDRIVNSFRELKAENSGKDLIVYCYSIPCMTGRKIGKMLAEHDIYVKHLGVGWNEWRYYWRLWNHEGEWNTTKAEDYITAGKEPGSLKVKKNSTACPISGEFGC